MNRHKSMIN